ncbi:MAG: hypothetical protein QM710_13045 [Flavobacterium sp.]
MQKIIGFLNRHSIIINSVSIVFWLYIIYSYYRASTATNSSEGNQYFYIIPVFFIVLSVFNMVMFLKRKDKP